MIPGSSNPLMMAAAPAAGGYQVSRSLRFNSSDSGFCSRTPAVAGNRKTWTWAGWVKRSDIASAYSFQLFSAATGATDATYTALHFYNNALRLQGYSTEYRTTTAIYRDPGAWMHVVCAVDTTQATGANRIKLYVNGVEVTTFSTSNDPSQNADLYINSTNAHRIGSIQQDNAYSNGYLADIHFIDGQALTPSSFTEVSATTGQLIPKAYTGTYGTNGFQLKFADNSSNTAATLGKDTSGNSNNWTPNNFSVTTGNGNYVPYLSPSSGSFYPTGPALNLFDGSLTTIADDSTANGTLTFTPATPIPYNSSIEINQGSSQNNYKINGGSNIFVPGAGWTTLATGSGTITSIQNISTGNYNNWRAIRIDGVILVDYRVAAGNDSLVDTPTSYGTDTGVGGSVRGNYCTLNPLDKATTGGALSNGNLDYAATVASWDMVRATFGISSGKWYWEVSVNSTTYGITGIAQASVSLNNNFFNSGICYGYNANNGYKYEGSPYASLAYGATWNGSGDICGVAFNSDAGTLTFYKNGVSQGVAYTGLTGTFFPAHTSYPTGSATFNFGQRAFAYTAPSGFKALCDTNLGAPLVAKPNTVMDVKLYTGNGAANTITGLAFSPDLVWIKARSAGYWHELFDVVRGVSRRLFSNDTAAEDFRSGQGLTAFNADGFSLTYVDGNDNGNNGNGSSFVAWCWDAGTSTVTNTAGSITSQVRANASSGFSVVKFNQTSSNQTIGHGLGVEPTFIIGKTIDDVTNWRVYHKSLGASNNLFLNLTNASSSSNDRVTAVSSSTFTCGGIAFGSYGNQIAYCFAPVVGYSSMGSYVGNGSSDGPFVYTGFRPRWIMVKRSDSTGNWTIKDTSRPGYNVTNLNLFANLSSAETTEYPVDLLSNGFKVREGTFSDWNANGGTYIYYAISETAFQYSRAR